MAPRCIGNYLYLYKAEPQVRLYLYLYCYSNLFVFLQIKPSEGITISKKGSYHRLKIHKVTEDVAGKYKFEADGRKTEALIVVEGINISPMKVTSLRTGLASFIGVCP